MSMQALRDFINRSLPIAGGLAALTAALDAKAHDAPLDPALGARIQELLSALGAGDVLDGVSAEEAWPLALEVRHLLRFDSKLLHPRSRATEWSYDDDDMLQDFGAVARVHGQTLSQRLVPGLAGLSDRLAAPGAAFLDVGVGVAGLAIAMAEAWPNLHVTGIDVWSPSLRLARENIARAGMGERITLREEGAQDLADEHAYDLVWLPTVFMAERFIPAAIARSRAALKPGGWLVVAHANLAQTDPLLNAQWRLRTTMFGGPQWVPEQIAQHVRAQGLAEVRIILPGPGVPVVFVVGRHD